MTLPRVLGVVVREEGGEAGEISGARQRSGVG